ncbi:MAG TPA: cysteine--tRNA ligase [Anaerolineae bacterium]|nr:cysteine--tRNA ligase [Anaerolineae bacterium]HQJ50867.1 cysteine--tRNA ligase [Anaerolineae bacterium]
MALRIYSTLSRQKEDFVTLEPGAVKMYVCGPNLYGPAHVGHAMSYIIFDTIRRYLQYRGYRVKYVQNFTDIEDRIIETAHSLNTTVQELAEKYIARFYAEMDALNVLRADYNPRATGVIPKIIEIVAGLVEKGYAYPVDGDVYFRVTRMPDYGKLSHRALDGMEAGARIEVDERKEHPMDFALWKASKPGEPAWDSPWGKGRPGWHIECSAMSMQYLGEQLDIHGGGHDVIFPHHENEIAQSEAFTGKVPFVRYWVHNALLRLHEGEEKMTRHLGNIVSIQEALDRYSSDAIRLFILSSHYRSPLTWKDENILAAERGVERIKVALKDWTGHPQQSPGDALCEEADRARNEFIAGMDDDFNSPRAIAQVYELARLINAARDAQAPAESVAYAQGILHELTGVLGLTLKGRAAPSEVEPFIALLVLTRNELRAAKQFALADQIRNRLAGLGVVLEDSADGTAWKYTG